MVEICSFSQGLKCTHRNLKQKEQANLLAANFSSGRCISTFQLTSWGLNVAMFALLGDTRQGCDREDGLPVSTRGQA